MLNTYILADNTEVVFIPDGWLEGPALSAIKMKEAREAYPAEWVDSMARDPAGLNALRLGALLPEWEELSDAQQTSVLLSYAYPEAWDYDWRLLSYSPGANEEWTDVRPRWSGSLEGLARQARDFAARADALARGESRGGIESDGRLEAVWNDRERGVLDYGSVAFRCALAAAVNCEWFGDSQIVLTLRHWPERERRQEGALAWRRLMAPVDTGDIMDELRDLSAEGDLRGYSSADLRRIADEAQARLDSGRSVDAARLDISEALARYEE